jgi:Zn-dependent protease
MLLVVLPVCSVNSLFPKSEYGISPAMTPTANGSIRLFRVYGINVFIHWSWFLVAIYEIQGSTNRYSSIYWNVLEYLALFMIVLMHEFGHSLACRQVGGQADQIVLWPLGGVAYVSPPQRPGAMLWSIAAGPLVNVALALVLGFFLVVGRSADTVVIASNISAFIQMIFIINLFILGFNLLPIYPLDGGQILRSLLWFIFGRANSLMIASIIGFVGVGVMVLAALWMQSIWVAILAVFILLNCWRGLTQARALAQIAKIPRRDGFACPHCRTSPPRGAFWICSGCNKPFDAFETNTTCPHCMTTFSITTCMDCQQAAPISEWVRPL